MAAATVENSRRRLEAARPLADGGNTDATLLAPRHVL